MLRARRATGHTSTSGRDERGRLFRPPDELVGHNIRDFLPPDVADAAFACIERALERGKLDARSSTSSRSAASAASCESRMVPSGPGEVVTIVRDFTEQRRAEAELRPARRGAGGAAARGDARRRRRAARAGVPGRDRGGLPRCSASRSALLLRFEEADDGDDRRQVRRARPSDVRARHTCPRSRTGAALDGAAHRRAGARRRTTSSRARSRRGCARSASARASACRSASPASTWGALDRRAARRARRCPPETERRLQAFAELVALAVASAHARDELAASRLRIVEASDAERRRIERNLHDGAQQRLVALSVGLRLAQAKMPRSPTRPSELLDGVADELTQALDRAARAGAGHPSGRADRARPRRRARGARRADAAAGRARRRGCRSGCPSRSRRRPTTSSPRRSRTSSSTPRADAAAVRVGRVDGRVAIEVADDGVGRRRPRRRLGAPRPARPRRDARRRARGRERPGRARSSAPSSRQVAHRRHRRSIDDASPSSSATSRTRAASPSASAAATPAVLADARELQRRAVGPRRRPGGRLPRRRALLRLRRARAARRPRRSRSSARFAAHAWPAGERVRVRIGLHCGEAERPATATSASTSTARRASARPRTAARCWPRRRRPGGSASAARDLGEFEFRGLREPERVFQLVADDLPSRVPAAPQRPRARARPPGGDRRRLDAAARGARAAAGGGRDRGRRPGRQRGRAAAQGAQLPPRRRDRRHPHAADADRRGHPRGARDPREAPRDRRARPLPARRAHLRGRAPRRQRARGSATC